MRILVAALGGFVALVVLLVGALEVWGHFADKAEKQVTPEMRAASERASADNQRRASEHMAKIEEDAAAKRQAYDDRIFEQNVEGAAEVIVQQEFAKRARGRLPDTFRARAKFLEREGPRALAVVKVGTKEGLFDQPKWVNTMLVGLTYGDPDPNKYTWRGASAIAVCDAPPTQTQIDSAKIADRWPRYMQALVQEAKDEAAAKRKR